MIKQRHCERSERTLDLLLKLNSPTTFDEDIGGDNKAFDIAKRELESSERMIKIAKSIIERQEKIRARAMECISEINGK